MRSAVSALIVLATLLAGRLPAQTLEDVRNAIRNNLSTANYPHFVIGLIDLAEENELSGANYEIGSDPELDVSTLILPIGGRVPLGESTTKLYWETYLGYLDGEAELRNLFGNTPGLEDTAADSEWQAFSALGGLGLEFPVAERLTLTPLLNASISRVENNASYSGNGAGVAELLLDGILFNWNATFVGYGAGIRSDWKQPLGNDYDLELILRYDFMRLETTTSTDRAQDFSENSQRAVARLDFTGPTGIDAFGSPLRWRTKLAYRRFLSAAGEAIGFDDFIEVGAGLEFSVLEKVPLLSQLSLSGSVIYGDNVRGWSFGVGVKF